MARIRTIKPEFPQSERVGKLPREARLLFLMLFTIADDEGRARGASRMLASLLYPYDDDAPTLMEGWLTALERGGQIRRYEVDGSQYVEIAKWLEHQKIDKPSKSRLPSFADGSRIVANVREASATDLVSRTLDLGPIDIEGTREGGSEKTISEGHLPARPLPSTDKQAAIALGLAFLNAAGFTDYADAPPTFYRVSERAAAWIAAGWSEAMITAETRIVTERAGTTMPLAYYEKVFATAAARAAQPVPTATIKPAENVDVRPNSRPGNRGSLAEAGARLLERQRRLEQDDGLASDWSSDQSGRLLSSR
ncbi:hypothetical protein BjapCC829_21710 [Bradyrhizobium barranii]|uniref:Uncharacterized protein n=1 Tax=Bradyrhizobium barranii TaxID=2992140 RepID=A0ABY3QZ72_9BRAD|nr:hypothetical protein [Bradyrhizobium japonicum]UFW91010.1 hypothetical protein BjapCC829_21710 [Bradyrhizobium japonicum]